MNLQWIIWLGLALMLGCLFLPLAWGRVPRHAQSRELCYALERIAILPYKTIRLALHQEIERARRLGYELTVVSLKVQLPHATGYRGERHLRADITGMGDIHAQTRLDRRRRSELWMRAIMEMQETTREFDIIASDFRPGRTRRVLLLLLGASADGAQKALERMRHRIDDKLALDLVSGTAHFPNDGTVLEELVELARIRAAQGVSVGTAMNDHRARYQRTHHVAEKHLVPTGEQVANVSRRKRRAPGGDSRFHEEGQGLANPGS